MNYRDEYPNDLLKLIDELRDDIRCYEAMKRGVAVRIADLEADNTRLRGLLLRNTDPMDATPEDGKQLEELFTAHQPANPTGQEETR
jgi:hypothetical protein